MELFFLSALLPAAVIEHMPPSLFVTDLVQRNRFLHSVSRFWISRRFLLCSSTQIPCCLTTQHQV